MLKLKSLGDLSYFMHLHAEHYRGLRNSLSCFHYATECLTNAETMHTFWDKDHSVIRTVEKLRLDYHSITNKSEIYESPEDFEEFWIGKAFLCYESKRLKGYIFTHFLGVFHQFLKLKLLFCIYSVYTLWILFPLCLHFSRFYLCFVGVH